MLKLTPGISPYLLEAIFQYYDCIIIESFGVGGIPESMTDELFRQMGKYNNEKILIMTTQVTYEGSNIETYEVGRKLKDKFNILEAKDMTLESVLTKIMWILSDENQSWEQIRHRFYSCVECDTLY